MNIQQDNNPLDIFVSELMIEKGIPQTIDPTIRNEIQQDITKRLLTLINLELLEHIPQDKMQEFRKLLLKSTDDTALERFYRETIPQFEVLINRALIEFRELYLHAR